MENIYSYTANNIDGTAVPLSEYRGQVLLIVNTASQCGFTPQYRALESLFRQYQDSGFSVLAFPCNQFGAQEPGDGRQIAEFCATNHQVSFPLFEKIDVNGDQAHPLFRHLQTEAPGLFGSRAIKWNFSKFLIDRTGNIYRRYAPITKPESLRADIERLLAAPN